MLDYNILNQKPTITTVKDGEYVTYKDLLSQTYNGRFIHGGRIVEVEEYYIARPDLISLAIYGDDKYADIICKINGISNPFELNKGTWLYAPDISVVTSLFTGTKIGDDILAEYKTKNNNNKFNGNYKSNYTGKNKKSGDYVSSLTNNAETIDKKKAKTKKYKNERRSPGEQTVMDKNYIIDRSLGIVIY